MAADRAQNLQDTFLNHVRKNKTPLTIFLVNGVKLQGVVTWFDNFCVLLRRDGHSQLVYKHAISTIMPGHPIPSSASSFRSGSRPDLLLPLLGVRHLEVFRHELVLHLVPEFTHVDVTLHRFLLEVVLIEERLVSFCLRLR